MKKLFYLVVGCLLALLAYILFPEPIHFDESWEYAPFLLLAFFILVGLVEGLISILLLIIAFGSFKKAWKTPWTERL